MKKEDTPVPALNLRIDANMRDRLEVLAEGTGFSKHRVALTALERGVSEIEKSPDLARGEVPRVVYVQALEESGARLDQLLAARPHLEKTAAAAWLVSWRAYVLASIGAAMERQPHLTRRPSSVEITVSSSSFAQTEEDIARGIQGLPAEDASAVAEVWEGMRRFVQPLPRLIRDLRESLPSLVIHNLDDTAEVFVRESDVGMSLEIRWLGRTKQTAFDISLYNFRDPRATVEAHTQILCDELRRGA